MTFLKSTQERRNMYAPNEQNHAAFSRRSFLKSATLAGATSLTAFSLIPAASAQQEEEANTMKAEKDHLKKGDREILVAAEIAEPLAVTTYSNIINTAPFFKKIP